MFKCTNYKELENKFIFCKEKNESLITESEQLKFLIESSDDMISIHDFEGNYLYWYGNEKHNITVADIIGKTPFDIFEKDIANQIVTQIKKTFQTGEKSKIQIKTLWQGKETWFEETIFPIRKNDKIVSVVKICRDINEKKKAILKLKKQKQFFQKVVNSFTHPLYVINAETYEIEFTNDYALKENLPYGIKCYVYSHQSSKPCLNGNPFCPVNLLKYNGKPVVAEHVHTNKTGEKRYFEVHGFPINDENGKLKQVIEYNIEITDKKTAEKELQKAKKKAEESEALKSAFLANMSHEIRTPLNGILGFADLLKKNNLTEEKRNYYIDIINKSGNHLLELINDIIDVSKFDSGLMQINESECNLHELMSEVYALFEAKKLKNKKNLSFTVNNYFKGSGLILTDILRVKQILINLVGNALKFTSAGKIEVNYSLKNSDEIEFSVEDTGIGIDKANITFIFNRFRQAKSSTVELFGGTGLGLSVSKACVELLGGKIGVDSEPGKGSIFKFTIPYKPV